MEIVGSLINTSHPGIDEIIENRNKEALIALCKKQLLYGSTRIALNCATRLSSEVDDMIWMTRLLQDEMEVLVMPDTPNPEAIKAVVKENKYGRVLIDSTTCEENRIAAVMPIVEEYNCQITVLLQDENGMPKTVDDRLRVMKKAEQMAKDYHVKKEDMFIDNLVFPLAIDDGNGRLYMDCLRAIQKEYPGYRFTCGLNNISFGMPSANYLNITFLLMIMALGQDCFFVDIDPSLGAFIKAAQAILGEDEYTMEYISAFRSGWFPQL